MSRLIFCAVFLCIIALTINFTESAWCHGRPKADAHVNTFPFITNEPKFIRQVKNGKLYHMGDESGDNRVNLIHLYGSPYELGYAHGELMKDDLHQLLPKIWKHIEDSLMDLVAKLPEWLGRMIIDYGLEVALDFTYEITRSYTGAYFYEEIQGLSEGAQVDYKLVRRIHMLGELTKGRCSMMGAWGEASYNGTTIQLRSFDWDVDGPFKDYPSIMVYHPDQGHTFANIGFIGWIGSFSGMSSTQMAISEIGIFYPDDTFGKETRWGIPFVFLLRDILQFDNTLDDSINRMNSAPRTCDLVLAVGDGKLKSVRGFQYSYTHVDVMDDMNQRPYNETWHPRIKDVVYLGMDWLCEPYSQRMSERIRANYGKITPEIVARDIVGLSTTGNLQVSVYDLTNQHLYVSFARRSDVSSGALYAYDRPYFLIDMTKLWAEKPN